MKFNYYGFKAIYVHEMNRFLRTVGQSLLSPLISTSLYFVVFGSVIGGYIQKIDGVSYGSYIVPGLLMLTLLTQSISNTSFVSISPHKEKSYTSIYVHNFNKGFKMTVGGPKPADGGNGIERTADKLYLNKCFNI